MNATQTYPATANNATVGQAGPRVPGAIASLGDATGRLHERLTNLLQRLEPILAPLPPASVGEGSKLARHSLALQIESEADKVNNASDRVDSLISRLEI